MNRILSRLYVCTTLSTAGLALLGLTGCSALVSTTNTTADAVHTVTHGLSVSSRSSTNLSKSDAEGAKSARTRAFVESQHLALQREAAAGGGEHIDTLARLIETNDAVAASDGQALGQWMQANYRRLFAATNTQDQLIEQLDAYAS